METIMHIDSYPKADIQLWGKGYRISADSEEFQRYLPKDPTESQRPRQKDTDDFMGKSSGVTLPLT